MIKLPFPVKQDKYGNQMSTRKNKKSWTLTNEQKADIKMLSATYSLKTLARKFGVSEATIRYHKDPVGRYAIVRKSNLKYREQRLAQMRAYMKTYRPKKKRSMV